ncbi:hypothetical protein [Sphingobacterium siyangense]|uniref:hypothetical protein n=1 Tax=Sphingobacterium siyangense TaxID=459529 RepID=UPI003017C579
MSDETIDLEFKLNTSDVKKDLKDMENDAKSVNSTVKDGNAPLKEREGIIERLKRRMRELRADSEKATDYRDIARYNQELVLFGQELERAGRAGRKGFDEYGNALVSNEGILQRLKRAAALYEQGMLEATRTDNLEKYSQKLALVNAEISKLTKNQSFGGGGQWNGLQNSINQIARELPAFTFSVQTGLLAMSNNFPIFIDEVNRAKAANAALVADGKKGIPVWKQVASSIFSWQTAMMIGITIMTVYGKQIGDWISALFKGKDALEALRKANEEFRQTRLKGVQDAQKELESLGSLYRATQNTTLSVAERKKAVDALQNQYPSYFKNMSDEQIMAGKAAGAYDKLRESIIGAARARAYQDKIAELAGKRLENEDKIINTATSNIDLKSKQKQQIDLSKDMIAGSDRYTSQVSKVNRITDQIDDNNEAITALNESNALIDKEMMRYQKNIDSLVKKNGVEVLTGVGKENTEKDVSNLYNKIANSSEELLNKIADLDKEYARKSMESDEAELQGLQDKFDKFRRLIEKENKKINDYNDKNKGKKGFKAVDLIDVSQLDPIQDRATEDLKYKHSTNALKKEIEAQKQVFQEYEEYKNQLGKEKADDVFKDRLKGFKSYLEYLKSVEARESDAINAVDQKTGTAGQYDRAKLVKDEQKEATQAENKKQSELLALFVTYDQKRKELIRKFEEERASMLATASVNELAEFDRKHLLQLNALDDSNIQQLDAYKDLFKGIENLSDASARRVIKNAQVLLASDVNISPDMLKKIQDALKQATKSLDEKLPDRVMKIAGSFNQMAQAVREVNEGLGGMLQAVGDVLAASVQIGENITALGKGIDNYNKYKTEKANGAGGSGGGMAGVLGGISAIAGVAGPISGIVSAVAGVASGVFKFFGAAKESARLAEKQLKEYQQKIIEGELEYSRLIRERARSQKEVNDMSLAELATQKELLKTQLEAEKLRDLSYEKKVKRNFHGLNYEVTERVDQQAVLTDYEYALQKILNEGVEVTGQRKEKYGGILGIGKKTRLVDVTASLAGKTYDDLERLYTEGKMNDATKALFENLQKAKQEVDDINELMKEIDEQVMDKMTNSLKSSTISDSIIQGLKDGKRAVVDWSDDINEIVQDALLSAMNATVLEEPLMELVRKFREDAKDGLTEKEIEEFKKGYEKAIGDGLEALKEIEKITGTVGKKESNSSLDGRINRTVSEDTASSILGFERSRYDLAKQSYQLNQKSIDFHLKSYDALVASLLVQKGIEQNTKDSVNELKNAVSELKSINKNTSQQSTRAYGG